MASAYGSFFPTSHHPHWTPTSTATPTMPPLVPISSHQQLQHNRDASLSPKISEFDGKSHHEEVDSNCSDDERPQFRRSRSTFTQSQLRMLEKEFEKSHYPDLKTREACSEKTSLSEARIQVIFSYFLCISFDFVSACLSFLST